jgi:hypothetical protein
MAWPPFGAWDIAGLQLWVLLVFLPAIGTDSFLQVMHAGTLE